MNNNNNPFKSTTRFSNLECDAFQKKRPVIEQRNNTFLRKPETTHKSSFVTPVISITSENTLETDFPSLVSSTNNLTNKEAKDAPSFKTMLNTQPEEQDNPISVNVLPPGWLRLDANTCYTIDDKPEPSVKDVMECIIDKLNKKHEQYKETYDSINGPNAYMDLHYLEPIYKSDDDDDEGNEPEQIEHSKEC